MRTDQEIVDQTNAIAREMYANMGYQVPDDHKFYDFERDNYHPLELICWKSACAAQLIITNTDVDDALANLDG